MKKRSAIPQFEEWQPSMPAEWVEQVDEGKGRQRAIEIAQEQVNRSKWKRRGVMFLNGAISLTSTLTGIEELKHLKLKTKENNMTLLERLSLKLQSTKEGYAWLLALLVIIGGYFGFDWSQIQLMEVYEIVAGAIAAVFAAYYAVKDLLVRED